MRVTRVAGHIGALVEDVDLAGDLDVGTVAAIRAALLRHKVLFFRDQELDHARHTRFARRFGRPTRAHPLVDEVPDGNPEILTTDHRADAERYGVGADERRRDQVSPLAGWHTDLTPLVNPPAICVLRADVVPAFGGDTTWTNLAVAYAQLSAPLRALADTLHAEHRYLSGYQPAPDERDGYRATVAGRPMAAVHPVVRIHPETAEPVLFVNPLFTARIVELSGHESRRLLDLFFEHLTAAAYTVRFSWAPGSVAMWDNRATAHVAPADLGAHPGGPVDRIIHRVSLVGDEPVGPDGRRSRALRGEPWPAYEPAG